MLTPEERGRLTVVVAGRAAGGEVLDPKLAGLEVEVQGYRPHDQVIAEMARADALLLTLEDLPGSQRVIPAKLFEYLAARRPILALAPQGQASAIVQACEAGVVLSPGQPQPMADLIRQWLRDPPPTPGPAPAMFNRVHLARLLARALEAAVHESGGGARS